MIALPRPALASPPKGRAVSFPRAFSLLELVIVLAIMAVVASLASVRYAGALATYRVDAAARRLQADFETARQRSRTLGVSVYLDLDADNSSYDIRTRAEINSGAARSTTATNGPIKVDLRDAPYNARIARLTSSSGSSIAIFEPTGICSTTMRIAIRVGERERTVELDASSGRSTIK